MVSGAVAVRRPEPEFGSPLTVPSKLRGRQGHMTSSLGHGRGMEAIVVGIDVSKDRLAFVCGQAERRLIPPKDRVP